MQETKNDSGPAFPEIGQKGKEESMDYQKRIISRLSTRESQRVIGGPFEPDELDDNELWEDDGEVLPCSDTNKPGTECCESCEYQDECMEQVEDL